MPKKILILASISRAFYNFSFEFLQKMRSLDHQVFLSIPDDPVNVEFEKIGVKVIPAPLNRHGMNPLAELMLGWEYFHLMRSIKPDAVMSFTIKPNTYGGAVARFLKVPYMASVTGIGTVFYNDSTVNHIIRRMLRFGIGKAHCVFFQNQANLERFKQENMLHSPVRMIPGSGVNLELRCLLPYPDDMPVRFLMMARASKEKGVAEYIDAARHIKAVHPGCEFHYAGFVEEGEYGTMVRNAVAEGIIIDHGFLNNEQVKELMRSIHAVVLPSYHEGMSNVLLEAAAYGRPILASDVPGCRETMHPGKTGLLFEARSAESLKNALEKFLVLSPDQKKAMGIAGRDYVSANFDRNITVSTYMDELNHIFGE